MTLPTVAVGALVVREDLRILIIRRGHPPAKDSWTLPGGKVHPGERLHDALCREILEETGLCVEVGPLIDVVEVLREGYHYVILDYLCSPSSTADDARAADDAAELRWVTRDELGNPALGMTEQVLGVIEKGFRLRR